MLQATFLDFQVLVQVCHSVTKVSLSWQVPVFLVISPFTALKQKQWTVKLSRNKMPFGLLSKSVKSFYCCFVVVKINGKET